MNQKIFVTKTYLPGLEEYTEHLKDIWESGQLTNAGSKFIELQQKLAAHLGVSYILPVSNGTIALQLAIKALELKGEIITTPFSYVATVSSIVWEGCEPVFVDIDRESLCIDSSKIEAAITSKTSGILATHVYGNPCDVIEIKRIADKHGLKVIYDAAHAFDVQVSGRSILNFGDISTLSFHATKVFHSAEGGAVVASDPELIHRLGFLGNFGHKSTEEFWGLGVNAKISELQAAMGLCVLPHIGDIIDHRKECTDLYNELLSDHDSLELLQFNRGSRHNYSYYPVIFESESMLKQVRDALNAVEVYPRRYFYPSLDHLPYVTNNADLKIANDISKRILCLPLSAGLSENDIRMICSVISQNLDAE
jgi:dTDP-4-amino-4,6-dideoxygalactose transaminase